MAEIFPVDIELQLYRTPVSWRTMQARVKPTHLKTDRDSVPLAALLPAILEAFTE